jgi:putative transposase
MSRKYKFHDPEGIYFVSFATVEWIDLFTRPVYKDILVDSLTYCQQNKGLILHAWVIMTNHVHLIFSCNEYTKHSYILRDFKKFTSNKIIQAIKENNQESRKKWLLEILEKAGSTNSNNEKYQLWQQNNHPIEIYSPQVISRYLDYLHLNPVKEGYVSEPEDFLYSSAIDYVGKKGKLEVVILDIPSSLVGYQFFGK